MFLCLAVQYISRETICWSHPSKVAQKGGALGAAGGSLLIKNKFLKGV